MGLVLCVCLQCTCGDFMQNTVSIKENRDFTRLYKSGKFYSSDCLILYVRKNRLDQNRLGVTVSKKVGKAVVRNRVRRRIKESYREIESRISASYDFVVVARGKAAECDYKKIRSALIYLMRKAGLYNYEKNITSVD